VWVHAVSVGELLLADGLLGRLRDRGHILHVTTGTPAGLALLQQRLSGWDKGTGRVTGSGFPLDDPVGLAPFFEQPPKVYLALETELWPNLLRELHGRGIPTLIVNGRLTERTLGRFRPLFSRAAGRLTRVVARDAAAAEAFRLLGAPDVILGGNLKADAPAPRPLHDGWVYLRKAWAEDQVVVAGNTLDGEEALILAAWEHARRTGAVRLILAPRQPRRFDAVADLLRERGLRFRRASGGWPTSGDAWRETEVLLLDTLGELAAAYGEGSVALVGGGWTWDGGHNPLEPLRWGVPTLIGPGFKNFMDLVEPLSGHDLLRVTESEALAGTLHEVLQAATLRPQAPWGTAPLPPELCGTLDRTLTHLEAYL